MITLLCLMLGQGCSEKKEIVTNDKTKSSVEMLDSGVRADLIYSISEQTNVGGFFKKLGLVDDDDHWEEAMGQIESFERESGVNIYTILGGGVEFTTRVNAAEESDAKSFYSKATLTCVVTSFTYSVNGQPFSKILVEGHYVD